MPGTKEKDFVESRKVSGNRRKGADLIPDEGIVSLIFSRCYGAPYPTMPHVLVRLCSWPEYNQASPLLLSLPPEATQKCCSLATLPMEQGEELPSAVRFVVGFKQPHSLRNFAS